MHVSSKKHGLLVSGDSVLIGLSGGPDSVALLHLLTRVRKPMSLTLHAVYLNHGLRPRSAIREEEFCRRLCARWKVPLTIIRENVPALARSGKMGFEEAAREVRYRHFERLAAELNCNRIALGHQQDDQVETILFRILRGTGRPGLLGIPARRGKIIRPLIDITRDQILAYLSARKIGYCEDRSNENTRYRRNLIRRRLLPLIKASVNPQVESALLGLADTLGEEEEFLDGLARRAYRRIRTMSPGGKLMLDLQIYGGYSIWQRRRVLRHAVAELTDDRLSLDKKQVNRLDLLALSRGRSLSLASDVHATVADGRLVLSARSSPSGPTELTLDNRWHIVEFAGGHIRARESKLGSRRARGERRSLQAVMDRRKIVLPLTVRMVKPGDRFRPLGLQGRKKVGDYLTDRKFPAVLRDEVAAIWDAHRIVWLSGWDIAEDVKVDRTTSEVVRIEFRVVKKAVRSTV
ncbi:MAG: tRNA lysidine(34) synthetase TilS [candidate division Zixibacteria bacterium]|nr:tRNA lysidine(34) synthetase TilS [candidate division Zixibacteria bacterium]